MKKILLLAMAALFAMDIPAFAGQTIGDKPLIEMLKEKGVLTDEDVKAIEKDEKSNIEIGGRLHVQYRSEGQDTGPAASTAHAADKTGFLVKRMTVEFKAALTDMGYMQIEPEFGGATGWSKLNDAFIAFKPAGGLNVYAGQKKVPFSWEELTSSKNLSFIDSGYASQIGVGRQVGTEVEYFAGDKLLALNAGIYNGMVDTGAFGYLQQKKQRIYSNADISGNDNKGGNMLAARVELHPMGYLAKGFENFSGETKLAIGLSYYKSDDTGLTLSAPAASATTVGSTSTGMWSKGSNALGLDATFRTGGLEVSAEAASRTLEYSYKVATVTTAGTAVTATAAGATEDNVSQTAMTVSASYLLTEKLALAARYETFNYGDENKFTSGGVVKATQDTAMTAGISYYIKKHNMKIQANYIKKDEAYNATVLGTKDAAANDVIVVQAGYSF